MMSNDIPRLTRRRALQASSGLLGLGALGGMAGGVAETVPVAVGYRTDGGRRAALNVASEVVYDYRFDAVAVEMPADDVGSLRQRDDVRYVEGAVEFEAFAQVLPWGIDRIDAEVAHANGETGDGADIAIIDTGIDNAHADLSSNLGEGATFLFSTQAPAQQDDNGHGTHCAGVADAVDNSQGVVGASTNATLHGIKAFTAAGVGVSMDIAAAIDHTADQGYEVASMSFGASEQSELIRDACENAYGEGVLLVAAAGNSGPCEDCVAYPATYTTVVAVSATDRNDGFAPFSSQGTEVELAAPGVDIHSTFLANSYARLSGTSMACPHVSGVGALLMADGLSNEQARQRLTSTAEDIGLSEREQGNGLVDAAAALGLDSSDDLDSSPTEDDAPTSGERDEGRGSDRDGNGGRSDGSSSDGSDETGDGDDTGGSGSDGGSDGGRDGDETGGSGSDGGSDDTGDDGENEVGVSVETGDDGTGASVSSDTGL